MSILAVIPARYASKRFPGKPLAKIGDKPMIQWVYEAAKRCDDFSEVVVATDDDRIADCVAEFGGQIEITSNKHETGTDRVAEVVKRYPNITAVANVQGDQPFVTPNMLSQLVKPYLCEAPPPVVTLACPLDMGLDYTDPNTVKVLCDCQDNAIYFSRSPIPYRRNTDIDIPTYHHLGLYAFSRDFLLKYAQFSSTPLERCEGLEQLRILEHGFKIRVCFAEDRILEINTPDDLERAIQFRNLTASY